MKFAAALLSSLVAVVFLSGCYAGPWDAPPFAVIQDTEDLNVSWSGCRLNQTDGLPTNPLCEPSPPVILRFDARVEDERTGDPLNNVRSWFTSGYSKIYLLPQEVLEAVDVPETDRWEALVAEGEIFAEFSEGFDGDYKPTYHETWTDSIGVASVWIFVEEMPTDDTGTAKESGIIVSIGADTQVVKLAVQG